MGRVTPPGEPQVKRGRAGDLEQEQGRNRQQCNQGQSYDRISVVQLRFGYSASEAIWMTGVAVPVQRAVQPVTNRHAGSDYK